MLGHHRTLIRHIPHASFGAHACLSQGRYLPRLDLSLNFAPTSGQVPFLARRLLLNARKRQTGTDWQKGHAPCRWRDATADTRSHRPVAHCLPCSVYASPWWRAKVGANRKRDALSRQSFQRTNHTYTTSTYTKAVSVGSVMRQNKKRHVTDDKRQPCRIRPEPDRDVRVGLGWSAVWTAIEIIVCIPAGRG